MPRPASPNLTDEQRKHLIAYWEVAEQHDDELNEKILLIADGIPGFGAAIRTMSPEQIEEQRTRGRELRRAAFVDGDWDAYLADLTQQGAMYAHLGVAFRDWFPLITSARQLTMPFLDAAIADRSELLKVIEAMDHVLDLAMAAIGEAYLGTKEQIISEQQAAIFELSTPVLQVHEGLLILPLVGMVDTTRARQLTEDLLLAIRERRARVAVMDITGVPIVDSKVANHFVQTVRAAGLMGAEVIVTGISPEIAQTLVGIGAEMQGVRTLADLQSGIEAAEQLLHAALDPLDPGADHAEAAAR